MLERLVVKNVALIDETEVEFGRGLNILTGETGAGKSILIDSINLALGAKADKNLIRQGAEYAYVELEFSPGTKKVEDELRMLDIFPSEDGRVILQRRVMPGKSVCKINGETVTGKTIKEAAAILIDIHGQHEHQSLLDEKKHRDILDLYCIDDLDKEKALTQEVYIKYSNVQKELEHTLEEDAVKDREIALAQFELKEIEEANLNIGEDETLEEAFLRMENVKTIGESVSFAANCLNGYEQVSVQSLLERAQKSVNDVSTFDTELAKVSENLQEAQELLRDAGRFLSNYTENLEIDGAEYAYTKERLDTINKLKSKYGNTIEEILAYAKEKSEFLNKFEDFEQYKQELCEKKRILYQELMVYCKQLYEKRCRGAKLLEQKLQEALLELNFPYARFKIEVTGDEAYLSKNGYDKVRFMISLNAGENLKPLSQVASGGELSRIMLALKTVLADQDEIETLIFDEIDAGISGKTAWKVSEKLGILGKNHQVICITHLPQIAAMADSHYLIEKHQTQSSTKTTLSSLAEDGMLAEIARLLGTDTVTETVMQNARELKEMAIHAKQY